MKRYLLIPVCILALFLSGKISAQGISAPLPGATPHTVDTLTAYFRTDSWNFNKTNSANREIAGKLADPQLHEKNYTYFSKKLTNIIIEGTSSPEGNQRWNTTLSKWRAEQIQKYILANTTIEPQAITYTFTGRDWETLRTMVEQDMNVPHRNQVLEILSAVNNATASDATLQALQQLGGSVPYWYMYRNIFPKLRATKVEFVYERIPNIGTLAPMGYRATAKAEYTQKPLYIQQQLLAAQLKETATATTQQANQQTEQYTQHTAHYTQQENQAQRTFFMALKSNLLYDALITPNLGIEFKLGKHYSVQGNWMYAWWKADPSAWYHRTYGGDISVRRWIGKKHLNRPLTGWHAGVYGQMLTYDFIWGKRGYLADRWSWSAGVEGGYSKAIGKRLNLDFSLNFGYLTGVYQEYIPQDGCYVWQATKQRRWIGPTKAEISLVWLLGKW